MYHYFTGIQTLFHQQQYEDVSLDHGQRLSRTTYTLQKTVGTGGGSGGEHPVNPISIRGVEQIMPSTLLLAPRFFTPSYGPAT